MNENNDTTAVEPVWAVDLASVPWTAYEDEHLPSGDLAAQLKIVNPNLFYAKFPPGFTAPVHSHPFATTYYVTQGRIRFGDEGWISAGQFRGVHAGHAYGPEEADPERGCEFILWSTGPISVDWAS
ncbi:cupin domain-containing protein [Amycolatopsis sp. H20-H5]|uniref:cupin domain-containing protein n=1 Tax=Amycolatopsis sp. H20-H5 TaxID=3046309 RepID=UPI002DBBBB3F|nr:hypothetical protein [Amycolatopsis sp. H20-H5]MEC3974905.1 hypothetical protein [Amycolatopsis sp. H20-H5]